MTDLGGAGTSTLSTAVGSDRPRLRILTCGSVDDGKSTLIGRLLYERRVVPLDQIAEAEAASRRYGAAGRDENVDFAFLLDGLEAEREQGITIDVSHRYFATPARSFIVADTPGHEQYTRNMATGASNAHLAVLLVDARKGLLSQTRRHATIVSLLGIRHLVLAVNKMDLVDYAQSIFDHIVAVFDEGARPLGFVSITAIPTSALKGDNVVTPSERMRWYNGPTLLSFLETIDAGLPASDGPLRLPVQWVNRADADFRGYSGQIVSGTLRAGDPVAIAASRRRTSVARIVTADGDLEQASAPDSITVVLADDLDVSRGDIICAPQHLPERADRFSADVIWMGDDPLLPGRAYLLACGRQTVPVTVTHIDYKLDVVTRQEIAAETFVLNDIGACTLSSVVPIAFDPYADNRETGSFILMDRSSHATVAAGMIRSALRRVEDIMRQDVSVAREARAGLKGQRAAVLWFTGLSGAGKSTIANLVEVKLVQRRVHTVLLDGDNVRQGLNRDLGFSEVDRVENIRRVGEVARLMADAGLIVLCCFISPFEAERRFVRDLLPEGEFIEVFMDTPLDVCVSRDPKGLYRRALAGQIPNFTGIDQAYERPRHPELTISHSTSPDEAANAVISALVARGLIS